MRLIHTADWHLGRLFHNQHLTADQQYVLKQLVELAAEVRPTAVIIAGDLYDRAVPPTEAVDLLDDVLTELVDRLGVAVVAIAGNHDSGARLGFAGRLLRTRGLHLVGELPQAASPIVLRDEHGPVRITALPFADPAEARHVYGDQDIHDQWAVCAAGVARTLGAAQTGERHVLAAHAFVAGGLESESERPVSVGGAQQVPAAAFDGFDYVALGHLHRPQRCGSDAVRYAGSLLKYSFAEHAHDKSVCVVDIGAPGSAAGEAGGTGRAAVAVQEVALSPLRDVRRLEGTLAELLRRGESDPGRDDYILASLLDDGALFDPIGRLRAVYPNALAIERPAYERAGAGGPDRPRPGSVSDVDLFQTFFGYVTGDELGDARRSALTSVIDALERQRREAAP
jgi:DNA repair protein SbcD/Mre11